MAVHASLARCLRTAPSSTLIRPMISQSSSYSCGQIHRVYQQSGYASKNSPEAEEANKQDSPSSQQASSKPSIMDAINLENTAIPQATIRGHDGITWTEDEVRLKKQMAELDSQMKELSRPPRYARTERSFFTLTVNSRKAEVDAEETLRNLLKKSELTKAESPETQIQRDYIGNATNAPTTMNNLDEISPPKLRSIPMKLDTKLGRQVLVQSERGIDCASAIRTVQVNCTTNGIRRQANLQKFHIRRGQRRKDLRSQRWRKLFKFSFDATVKKIQRMRDQGW